MKVIEYLIYNFLLIFIVYKANNTIFNKDTIYNKSIERISYILYYVFISIIYLLNGIPIVMMIFNILFLFLIQFNYKTNIKDKILITTYTYLTMIILDLFTVVLLNKLEIDIFSKLFKIKETTFISIPLYLIFFSIIIKSLSFFKNIKYKVKIPLKFYFPLLIVPFISIMLLVLLVDILKGHQKEYFVIILILLLLNICVFLYYNYIIEMLIKKEEQEIIEQKYLTYIGQFEIIKDKFESLNTLKHDIKKHFLYINKLILDENYNQVLEYMNELNNNEIVKESEKIVDTGNTYIDMILNLKLNEAIKNNIKVESNVTLPYNLNIYLTDMVCLLGNLLDNAIEANLKLPKDRRYIYLKMKYHSNSIFINVVNTYDKVLLDKKGYIISSKENRMEKYGLGIKIIKKIIKKYNGYLEVNYDNNIFNISVTLNLKNTN